MLWPLGWGWMDEGECKGGDEGWSGAVMDSWWEVEEDGRWRAEGKEGG